MNTYYQARHAEGIWSEDEDRPLSRLRRQDAERVSDILVEYPIDLIYSSPYQRTWETIDPLAKRLNLVVQIEPDLRERRLSREGVDDFDLAVTQTWSDHSFAHPGGESNSTIQNRGMAVLSRLQVELKLKHIVLSMHGNLQAVLLQHFDETIGFDSWKSMTFPDIYWLEILSPAAPFIRRLWG